VYERALLDTQTFIWLNSEPERLSARVREFIEDAASVIFFSAVSAWEIGVKHAKGRLDLPMPAENYVLTRLGRGHFQPLAIEVSHALHVGHLPLIHNDPFDRLLVSQAQLERLPILTSDANIARYDVEVIW
jgi:PIN domain nuclease of toxin-antitoxin system